MEEQYIRAANNRIEKVAGTGMLRVWIEEEWRDLEVWIVENLINKLLLGKEELQLLECNISLRQDHVKVSMLGQTVHTQSLHQEDSRVVHLEDDIFIPEKAKLW